MSGLAQWMTVSRPAPSRSPVTPLSTSWIYSDANKDWKGFPLIVRVEDPVKFNATLAGALIDLTDDGDEKAKISTTKRKHEDDIMPNSKMKKNIYSDHAELGTLRKRNH